MVHRHHVCQPLVVCVFLVACMLEADGFLSPVVWSRIAGGFRFYGNREGSSEGEMMRNSRNPWLGRYARSPSYATSPLSIASFGDDSLRGSLFDELKGLERKLQMAMNLGKVFFCICFLLLLFHQCLYLCLFGFLCIRTLCLDIRSRKHTFC